MRLNYLGEQSQTQRMQFKKRNNCCAIRISKDSFWRSLEMLLINCKVELKLKGTMDFVLSVLGNENDNAYLDSTIFTIEDKKLYVPVVTLLVKENQEL